MAQPYVNEGHETSGPTAKRPTGTQIGFLYFDTDTQEMLVYNGSAWKSIAYLTTTTT
jgi:hypothetical protein